MVNWIYLLREFLLIKDTITAIIKTFERPCLLLNLISSIEKYYPDLKIIVIDDSENSLTHKFSNNLSYIHSEFDIGTAKGRNIALDMVETEYFFLLDDDYEFTRNTKIERMVKCLDHTQFDLVGGIVLDQGYKPSYYGGIFQLKRGEFVLQLNKNRGVEQGFPRYDILQNFFLARTNIIKSLRWDDTLRLADHEDFFIRCKMAGLKITQDSSVYISHYPERSDRYAMFRNRINFDKRQFYLKHGLNKETVELPSRLDIRNVLNKLMYAKYYLENIVIEKGGIFK